MDYCHPCGRHLNGALACAGCGTPVEELRRHSAAAPAAAPDDARAPDVTPEPAAASPGPRSARRQASRAKGRRPAPAGRRARRRRGRTVVIGTVGLVLAAGALSLAELATESAGEGAATSVEERAVAEPEEIVEPSVSVAPPDGPAKVTEKPRASAGSPRPGGEATGKGNGAPGGESSKQAGEPGDGDGSEPSASEPPDGDGPSPSASQDPPEGGESPESPGEPGGPGEGDDPPPPPQAPPSQQPAPTPTPTCDRFLWWCL